MATQLAIQGSGGDLNAHNKFKYRKRREYKKKKFEVSNPYHIISHTQPTPFIQHLSCT
jgi:hypothetical protein